MEKFQPVPVDRLSWRTVQDFELSTPLGVDDCTVQVLDVDGDERVLRPGEEERIRRAQAKAFCTWVIESRAEVTSQQLHYLLSIFSIKQVVLARAMALSEGAVSQYIKGTSRITESTSRQIALLFLKETTENGAIRSLAQDKVPNASVVSKVPINELQQRGWIHGDSFAEILESVVQLFGGSLDSLVNTEKYLAVRYRKSLAFDSEAVPVACWLQGIRRRIAQEVTIPKFDRSKLERAIPSILELTEKAEGVSEVRKILNALGVHFFIEPNLRSTHLDGATFFVDTAPVIALTLRYDRIDWFWHTLLHEVAHIVLGHDLSEPKIDGKARPDDGDCEDQNGTICALEKDPEDEQADMWAAEMLVPASLIRDFPRTLARLPQRLAALSKTCRRHPGIVAGRLQYAKILPFQSMECAKSKVRVSPYLSKDLTSYHRDLFARRNGGNKVKSTSGKAKQ